MLGWLKRAKAARPQPGVPEAQESASTLTQRGNSLLEQGRPKEAAEHYARAAALDASDADSRVNLGYALGEQGLFAEAEVPLRQAAALASDSVDAYFLLAGSLYRQGKLAEAIGPYRHALGLKPDFSLCRVDLCRALVEIDEASTALELVREGLALTPDDADLHYCLGKLQANAQAHDKAVVSYENALAVHPSNAEVLTNLGIALFKVGRLDAAIERHEQALAIAPDFAGAHFNLGTARYARGRYEAAEQSFRQALKLQPEYADAHINLGSVLKAQGRFDAAVESLQAALRFAPESVEALNNLGSVLIQLARAEEALTSLRAANRINAELPIVHQNLGAAYQRLGDLDRAVEHYRRAIEIDPSSLDAYCNLLFVLSFHPGYSAGEYLAEARRFGAKCELLSRPFTAWPAASAPRQQASRLRIGLVSGDFRAHPVGFFIESWLYHVDRTTLEVTAYSTQPREDVVTARLKPHFAAWRSIDGLNDEEAAQRIHADGIDILIDLAGHSAHNRLSMFAWRAAPVQLTWLGYFASTGTPGVDWLIADPVSVPERHRDHFSEQLCYLPDTRLCFTPPQESPELVVNALPALAAGHVTFGCFQSLSKINPGVLATWGRILAALPDARLRLQNADLALPAVRKTVLERLAAVGIEPGRVSLAGAVPRDEYLAAYAGVDFMLDTFPYPGGTTTCEALWMGVPTLTIAGESMLARQGASLMACAGLLDWVAGDEDDYVDRALEHAQRIADLADLRSRLRRQVLASPVFDASRFARHMEATLKGLWRSRWENPASERA
jgi:protein O-GlcNAc transferase